jgi:hypothetical protein
MQSIDEFNYQFSTLSVRARNILRILEVDSFKNMLNFLQTTKNWVQV